MWRRLESFEAKKLAVDRYLDHAAGVSNNNNFVKTNKVVIGTIQVEDRLSKDEREGGGGEVEEENEFLNDYKCLSQFSRLLGDNGVSSRSANHFICTSISVLLYCIISTIYRSRALLMMLPIHLVDSRSNAFPIISVKIVSRSF